MPAVGKVEGSGTIRIEYRGQSLDLPFAMKMGGNGALEIEADVASGFWPGFGRIAIVSDQNDTAVYSVGRRVDPAAYDSLGPVLRPVLLSIFGGGEMLIHWLVLNGCRPGRQSICKGLEIGVKLDREHGKVERWTVRDPVGRVSFNGFVEPLAGNGGGARITGGMLHPYEIGITVRYARLGVAVRRNVASGDAEPGNFMKSLWLE
jgi:hypothetical protein